jgi:hypothetical protein
MRSLKMCAAILAFVGAALFASQAGSVSAPGHSTTQVGASYSYQCTDLSTQVIRSNAGRTMQDYIIAAGADCLSQGATLSVRNADPTAWIYLYGTLIESPKGRLIGFNRKEKYYTLIEGGVPLGGGCAPCTSVAFIAPGETATFAYDAVTTLYPNGTVGNAQGGAADWSIPVQTWRKIESGSTPPGGNIGSSPAQSPVRIATVGGFGVAGVADQTVKHARALPAFEADARGRTIVLDETISPDPSFWGKLWSPHVDRKSPWGLTRVKGATGDIVRLELRQGDHWANDMARGAWPIERSLLQANDTLMNGTTYWEGYSFLFECGATMGTDDFASGSYWFQIENIHSIGSPGFVVPIQTEMLSGGHFGVNVRTKGGSAQNFVYIGPQPLTCGVWHDVVRQFDLDPAGGFVNEWLDGAQIANFSGPVGNAGDSAYPEFELYRADYYGSTNTYAQDIANFEIGTSSLARRIKNPPTTRQFK